MTRSIWLGLVLLLAACGVRIEVAEKIDPTPTYRPWWRLYYSGSGVERVLALPVISFGAAEQPRAELFMQPVPDKTFVMQYQQMWLSVTYHAAWFAAPASYADVRLTVYQQLDGGEWMRYDAVEQRIVSDDAPYQTQDTLGISMAMDTLGSLRVRAEVSVTAVLANGETALLADAREFDVRVLSQPADVEFDYDALVPAVETQYGEDTLLLDWRGWHGGPCALAERALDTGAYPALSAACDAFNAADYSGTLAALNNAAIENQRLAADAMSMVGLLVMALNEPAIAVEAFTMAERLADAADDGFALAVQLNNLAVAHAAVGDIDSAWQSLACASEIRNQFWDEAGNQLHTANVGYLSRDYDAVEQAYGYLADSGLPQAATLERWLFKIEQGIE
jgi:hypothetical protein